MKQPSRFIDYTTLAPNHLTKSADIYLRMMDLKCRYNGPHRKYHNLAHIYYGYQQHANFFGPMNFLTFFAWTYHDAIYDPRASDNEAKSANLFMEDNKILGFPFEDADKIAMLILSTTHTGEKNIITDIDLSGLGSPRDIYEINVQKIRQEYSFLDDPTWAAGRMALLERFLSFGRIYDNIQFSAAYEAQARENLNAELLILKRRQ